jgi:hypothetical protein
VLELRDREEDEEFCVHIIWSTGTTCIRSGPP